MSIATAGLGPGSASSWAGALGGTAAVVSGALAVPTGGAGDFDSVGTTVPAFAFVEEGSTDWSAGCTISRRLRRIFTASRMNDDLRWGRRQHHSRRGRGRSSYSDLGAGLLDGRRNPLEELLKRIR